MKTEVVYGSIAAALFIALQGKVEFILPLSKNLSVSKNLLTAVCGFVFGCIAIKLANHIRWMLLRQLLTYTGWIKDPRSRRSKIFGFLLKLLSPNDPKLFDYQKILPRLPLPTLKETCHRVLDVVRPLLNEDQRAEVKVALKELVEVDGPPLQAILEKRYNTEQNWLEEYWENAAYLSARCPLPVNLNFAMLRQEDVSGATMCSRAAMFTYQSMKYKRKIETRTLRPLRIMNLVPICNNRYNNVFSCTRVPGAKMDEMKRFNTNHIIVFRNGHMYKIEMLCMNDHGKTVLISPLAIQRMFEKIIEIADQHVVMNPAPLTTMDRTSWYHMRNKLLKSERNAASLEEVESAAFCVSLDNDDVDTLDHSVLFGKFMLGDSYNRWFDKSLTIIARSNAAVGKNCEHTTAEATLYGRLWEYVLANEKYDSNCDAVSPEGTDDSLQTTLQEITWELDMIQDDISSAVQVYKAMESGVDFCFIASATGKGVIKKLRIGPDGFVQMAIQLAFYRLHKFTPKTYETGSTRMYFHGRTETIRPVSDESVLYTKSFDDPSLSKQEKAAHLRAAVMQQTKNKYDAMTGNGVDRHLFALYVNAKINAKIPKLFTLKPFAETDRLSTSQSPMWYDPKVVQRKDGNGATAGGFGPQHAEGYGVAYFMMGDKKIHITATCYKAWSSAQTFAEEIVQAIDDQVQLLTNLKKTNTVSSNGNVKTNNNLKKTN